MNLRCDRKISQQDLARLCSITPSALSKIEAGINSPRANVIWRIAKNLGVTVEYLLDEEVPYPYLGYSYRHEFLSSNVDPSASVRMDITREEKSFLEAVRKSSQVAKDIVFAIPETSVENLRLVHFIINHSKVTNPTHTFLKSFEALFQSAGQAVVKTPGVKAADGDAREGAVVSKKQGPSGRKRGRPKLASRH